MILIILRFAAVLAIFFAGAALHGCTWYVYDATNKPIASNIVGRCYELGDDAILLEHFSYFTEYMLNIPGANECTPHDVTSATKNEERYISRGLSYPKCIWVPVGRIAKETKFKVTKVTEQPYGGSGRCWKVEVTFITGERAGITAGIPACYFDFPESELWVRMKSGNEYVEPLDLSDPIVKPCKD